MSAKQLAVWFLSGLGVATCGAAAGWAFLGEGGWALASIVFAACDFLSAYELHSRPPSTSRAVQKV